MTPAAGSAGTAGAGFRAPKAEPKHRAPPPVPAPRAPTVIAVAAAVLTAASLVAIAAAAVTPDASAAASGTTVATTAQETRTVLTAGPLVLPTVGVVAPAIESLYPTPSAPPQHTAAVSRGTRTSQTAPKTLSGALVATTTPPQQTVTPAVQPVSADQPAEPTPTSPADSPTPSATPKETTVETPEPPVTPMPTVTVDVEVGP